MIQSNFALIFTSLQAHVRGWQIRRQFLEQKHAAVVIQAVFRGWSAKKRFKADIRKIVIIQALVRRLVLNKCIFL